MMQETATNAAIRPTVRCVGPPSSGGTVAATAALFTAGTANRRSLIQKLGR